VSAAAQLDYELAANAKGMSTTFQVRRCALSGGGEIAFAALKCSGTGVKKSEARLAWKSTGMEIDSFKVLSDGTYVTTHRLLSARIFRRTSGRQCRSISRSARPERFQ
jgi:hypothetical protein